MAYIDVVTLAEAKIFLRVDDAFTEDDALITMLINVAGEAVEAMTNRMLYSRNKTYVVVDGEKRVYDYPITAVVDPSDSTDYEVTNYETYSVYELSQDSLELTVGYASGAVPAGLKLAMLQIIDNTYHGNDDELEQSEKIYKELSKYKRHII